MIQLLLTVCALHPINGEVCATDASLAFPSRQECMDAADQVRAGVVVRVLDAGFPVTRASAACLDAPA